jgi:hypothetical protein
MLFSLTYRILGYMYAVVPEEPAEQAAIAIAAFVPRRNRVRAAGATNGPAELKMVLPTTRGARAHCANSLVRCGGSKI